MGSGSDRGRLRAHQSCPPINMHPGRRATDMRQQFDLTVLVPAGGRAKARLRAARPVLYLRQRVCAIEVGSWAATQEIQLDHAPHVENAGGNAEPRSKDRIADSILEASDQARQEEE